MEYLELFKKHGVKLSHVAKKMNMRETHLRYHLEHPAKPAVNPEIESKLKKILRKIVDDFVKAAKI